MATEIRVIEGFNCYDAVSQIPLTADWYACAGTLSLGGGRNYGNAFVIDSSTDYLVHKLANTTDKYLRVGFAIKCTNHPSTWDCVCSITSSTNYPNMNYTNGILQVGSAGKIRLQGAHSNLLFESGASLLTLGNWHYVEIGIYENDTSGYLDLYVDGVEVHSQSGVDTYYGAQEYVAFDTFENANDFQLDDIYIAQSDSAVPPSLGAVSVVPLLPNGDTATADFTGTYVDVDDPIGARSDEDATYITANTLGAESRFDVESLPAGEWTVHGVAVKGEMKKSGDGARSAALTVTSGAATAQGADVVLSDVSYSFDSNTFTTNPDTAAQWTQAEIAAMQIGVKITL